MPRIKLLITALILLSAINIFTQPKYDIDSLRAGDSISTSSENGSKVKYQLAHLWNTSASLTDSIKFYLLGPKYAKGGRILRDTIFIDFIKKAEGNDSLQNVLVLKPTTGAEGDFSKATILINFPYPNMSMARLINEVYNTGRKTQIRWFRPFGSY